MTLTTEKTTIAQSTTVARWVAGLFAAATLLIVLQGLWAGLFIGKDDADVWVSVHARGAEASIVAAGVATVLAGWKLGSHRAIWVGGLILTALLAIISFVGGLITDRHMDSLIPVHVPLAMASLLVGTWLVVRTVRVLRS